MKWTLYIVLLTLLACNGNAQKPKYMSTNDSSSIDKIVKTEEEWKEELTPEQFYILREKGTERPFTGKYDNFYEKGHYECAACGLFLFDSESKFSSGCGWPSFSDVAKAKNLSYHKDSSHGMIRTEVTCARCGGHLGHVFEDGPPPTGLRYCINSAAIQFISKEDN